ncbi:MAG: metallophosphoesterase [Parvularculaceae bacterium]|nr:metallophosphoesterase [Parvularculaceae bacterium]
MIDVAALETLRFVVYWASYLYFPALALLIWLIVKRQGLARMMALLVLATLTVLAYARFVEPRMLVTREHDMSLERCMAESGSVRIAVFSDTHIGAFGNAMPVARIARAVNAADADLVMIAGDFTYWLAPEKFGAAFAALGEFDAPVFAVMGNHDVGLPGPDVGAPLSEALALIGVNVLDDAVTTIEIDGQPVELAGLSDLWADKQKLMLLEKRGPVPRLVLTHNPATIRTLLPRQSVDLMVSGHTHGGQINIPFVTCAMLPSMCRLTLAGLKDTERGPVFVTTGTGMVGLPMRFNAVPRVDVLDVRWTACEK